MNLIIPTIGFGRAGGFRTLAKLSNYLVRWGHQVTFLAPEGTPCPYYPIDDKVKIVWVNRWGKESLLDNPEMASEMPQLMKLVGLFLYLRRTTKVDHKILASFHLTAFLTILAGPAKKYYYIQAYEPEFYEPCGYSLKRYLFRFAAWTSYFLPLRRIVNAEIYSSYKNIRAKDIVLPGIDFEVYCPRMSIRAFDNKLIVGCIGRLEKWKGGQIVAEAVNCLRRDGFNIDLKVAFHALEGVEHYLCHPANDIELASFYKSVDVMVTPGLIQLGAVHYPVIEAMACMIPVVTTKYYPADDENAYIVKPGSVDSVVKALKEVMSDQAKTNDRAIRALERVSEFDWNLVSRKMEVILAKE